MKKRVKVDSFLALQRIRFKAAQRNTSSRKPAVGMGKHYLVQTTPNGRPITMNEKELEALKTSGKKYEVIS